MAKRREKTCSLPSFQFQDQIEKEKVENTAVSLSFNWISYCEAAMTGAAAGAPLLDDVVTGARGANPFVPSGPFGWRIAMILLDN